MRRCGALPTSTVMPDGRTVPWLATSGPLAYPPPLDRPSSALALRFPRAVRAAAVGSLVLGLGFRLDANCR